MARHNREGRGSDQCGFEYSVSYQPDWFRQVKVTRNLASGRQSTKTLFRNPLDRREAAPSDKVRTRIVSVEQNLDFEIAVAAPDRSISQIQISYSLPPMKGKSRGEEVTFTIENGMLPE
jgi:hypothetical protein